MIAAFAVLALSGQVHAQACESPVATPAQVQVAWISPVNRRAHSSTTMEVVRVQDLRAWIREHGADPVRVLQGVGVLPRSGGAGADWDWKITIFDVRADWVCRPIEDGVPGAESGGVPICDEGDSSKLRASRYGYTGCGYTLDTAASTRGIDVFRVDWETASSQGFCVMPLERFLTGA